MSGPHPLPGWALRPAGPHDWKAAREARRRQVLVVRWRPRRGGRLASSGLGPPLAWARDKGWRISRWQGLWNAEGAFLDEMLESDRRFALAIEEAGVDLLVPKSRHPVTAEDLRDMDQLYQATEDMGVLGHRATGWGALVTRLRELRRAVEAGVELEIEDRRIGSWGAFYEWAHGRYPGLEEGSDAWIGDDG